MTRSRTGPLLLIGGAFSLWILARLLFLGLSQPVRLPPPVIFADAPLFPPSFIPQAPVGTRDGRAPARQWLVRRPLEPAQMQAGASPRAVALAHSSGAYADTLPSGDQADARIVAAQSLLLARMLAPRPRVARLPDWAGTGLARSPALPAFAMAQRSAADRWSLSAALYVRRGAAAGALGGGAQLGGTQAWTRAGWQPDAEGPELFVRANSAGQLGEGAEAALGVAVRPVRALPLRIVAERRQRIGTAGRSAFAVYAVGGASADAQGWRLDGYGAAGVVGLSRRNGFVEGAATLARPVARLGPVELTAGGGAWGAAQPGAERLDIGPRLTARSDRIDGARLALDWRQRVAGDAVPDSGPALTLSVDF